VLEIKARLAPRNLNQHGTDTSAPGVCWSRGVAMVMRPSESIDSRKAAAAGFAWKCMRQENCSSRYTVASEGGETSCKSWKAIASLVAIGSAPSGENNARFHPKKFSSRGCRCWSRKLWSCFREKHVRLERDGESPEMADE